MKFRHLVGGIVVASTGLFSAAASAAPVISNLALSEISVFDAVITGTGATVGLAQVVDGGSIGKTNTIPFGRSSAGFGPLKQACLPVWWVCGGSGREIRCAARVAVVAVGVLDPCGRGAATGGRWRRAGWCGDDGSGTRGRAALGNPINGQSTAIRASQWCFAALTGAPKRKWRNIRHIGLAFTFYF